MKYKKIDMTSFNLHIIKTKRFKTINFRVCLRDKIKKEEITLRNALTSFLTYSTNTYRTKRDLVLKAQDLYAVNVYTKSYRSGRFNMINFCMSLLNEKYHEKQIVITSRTFSHYLCILSTQEENRAGKGSHNRSYLYKSAT